MKKLDWFTMHVQSVHPGQEIVVGKDEKGERIIVKGIFPDIYPTDQLLVYATAENNKKIGPHYRMSFYLEKKGENWLIKQLKFQCGLDDDVILRYILSPKKYPQLKPYQTKIKDIIRLTSNLMKKGLEVEVIAQIEQDYRWSLFDILEDAYRLLDYPSVSLDWVEEWIKEGWMKGKQTTKITYFIRKLLRKAYSQGHFYLPKERLQAKLSSVDLILSDTADYEGVKKEKEKWYLTECYEMEKKISQHIKNRLDRTLSQIYPQEILGSWELENKFTLAKNQKEAVWMALSEPFCVITGGPGVGKTTVCKCITDILGSSSHIRMVAPTGRAAKRAKESTGLEALTIHSLLEYNGVRFLRDAECPIEADVLVIDESSMVDAPLLLALMEATSRDTTIIFVGDVDQLPSVGAGQVLRDLIRSNVVPVTRLTEIFRQAADSPIIQCAYAVNRGEVPDTSNHPLLRYHRHEDAYDVLKDVLSLATELYRQHHPFDVQILIPMYEGTVGIHRINRALQERLHPDSPKVKHGDWTVCLGDKVIQTKNDKQKNVFNGDVGIVSYVEEHVIRVLFQGQETDISYERKEWHHLMLAYAVTVHRAQGSEYPYVVIPLVNEYRHMLQKNLFYTAITRTKKQLWIIYQQEALENTVREDSVVVRYTGLAEALQEKESENIS